MKAYDKMSARNLPETSSSRSSRPTSSSEFLLYVSGVPFSLDKELLATKSFKIAMLLKKNPQEDLSHLLHDIPTNAEIFELVARFCYGFELNLSPENVVPVYCLASYLGMSESHCSNNLLEKAHSFFQQKIINSWSHSIKALKSCESIFHHAVNLRLVDACVETLITEALATPHLLGGPIKHSRTDDDSDYNENAHESNVRRKLIVTNQQSGDLAALSIQLYEPIIEAMMERKVPLENVAASLYDYLGKWGVSRDNAAEDISICRRINHREIIEAVERLLPDERGLLPSTFLFEMLRLAIALEASPECRNGFEIRVGKRLDQATVKDLLIPSHGYTKEQQYDIECVRRILKNFYCNLSGSDVSALNKVATLMEDYLSEVASDKGLNIGSFISIAEMVIAVSAEIQRGSDGIYRALDIYLEKHKYLTESEKEEVCKILDCNKMSPEASLHAAQNKRLPLRLVVQVLFLWQLHLRETFTKEIKISDDRLRKMDELKELGTLGEEDETKLEVEKLGSEIMELERESYMIRKEIPKGYNSNSNNTRKNEKVSMWKEMKRKFGCTSGLHDSDCHVKKKKIHPR